MRDAGRGGAQAVTAERAWTAATALAVAAAAVLAAWGLGFGLPFEFRPDEDVMVGRAVRMAAEGSLDPLFQNYPPLVFLLLAAIEKAASLAGLSTLVDPRTADPTAAYLAARGLSAGAAVAAVACTGLAARRAFGPAAGFFAAAVLALAPLAVRQAHFATTDMVQAAFVAGATATAVRAGRPRDFLFAGVLAGLAAGSKYTGGLVLVVVAVLAAGHAGSARRNLGAAVAGAAAAFTLACLPAALHPADYARGLAFLGSNAYRDRALPLGIVFHPTVTLPLGLGPGAYAASIAGVLLAAFRRSRVEIALLAFIAAEMGLNALGHEVFFRYMLPLLPALAVLGGSAFAAALTRNRLAMAGLLLLLPGAWVAVQTDLVLAGPDSRAEAAAAVASRVPAGAALASPYYEGPFYGPRQVAANHRFVADDLAAAFLQGRYTERWDTGGPDAQWAITKAGDPGTVVAVFPGQPPGAVYDPLDAFYVPIWGIDVSRPAGPGVELVRR